MRKCKSISVEVDDPCKWINRVDVVHQTKDVVILCLDMTAKGKRAEPTCDHNRVYFFDCTLDTEAVATVKVKGMPFHQAVSDGFTGGYTCIVTFWRRSLIRRSKLLWELPANP